MTHVTDKHVSENIQSTHRSSPRVSKATQTHRQPRHVQIKRFFPPPTCVRRVLGCSVAAVHLRLSQITARAQLRAFQSRVRVKERDEARWECVCSRVCARAEPSAACETEIPHRCARGGEGQRGRGEEGGDK